MRKSCALLLIFHEGQTFRYMSGYDLDHYQIGYGYDILCKEYLNNHLPDK